MPKILRFPYTAWRDVAPTWAELAKASPYTSFFLTTDWIETWLTVFGPTLQPEIVLFQDGGEVVGACLLVRRADRRGPVSVNRIYLNAAGEDEADETCLEFNNLLCRQGSERDAAAALSEHLDNDSWDEFVARGFCEGGSCTEVREAFCGYELEENSVPSYYVNLDHIRMTGVPYENALGKTTRKHLRQNLRKYAAEGELRTEVASSVPDALESLDRLADLHQRSWTSCGQAGVFSSAVFTRFHKELIQSTFARGHIQLATVLTGDKTIGVLYSFVYRGKVYFYQSGLAYTDPKLSPGSVTIARTIEHCLQDGNLKEFDFMAGDSAYKKSLATSSRLLWHLAFRRASLKMRTLDLLRRLAHV